MAAPGVVSIHVEYLGHELGHWCNTCFLSTGVRLWWTTTRAGAATVLASGMWCNDCDGEDITGSDDATAITHIEDDD